MLKFSGDRSSAASVGDLSNYLCEEFCFFLCPVGVSLLSICAVALCFPLCPSEKDLAAASLFLFDSRREQTEIPL